MGTRRGLPALIGFLVLFAGFPLGSPQPVAAASSELFFSEYIEGSSNNKALEIYNDTGAAIDLAAGAYSVQMFFNGSATAGLTINLTGSVAQGDVFVVAHSSANSLVLAQADQTNGAGWFNGDDAVALRKDGVDVDVIGQIGFDPGAQWGTGFVSTADNTIRRKASVNAGDTNGADVFDPAMEWDGFDTDIFDGLGSHNTEVAPTVASKTPDDGATDVALGSNISVTFSEPVTVTGSWFTISCGSSGAHTATVTGGPTTFTLDPDVDFGASEVCTVTVIAAQVADQDVSDPPDNMAANAPFSFTTAGVVNVCEQPFTHTYEIQGSGNSAAITGNVTTQGVVVGDFEGPITAGIQGFYLQDASGDSDAATSDGIYVFTGDNDNGVNVGDLLRVTGFARERFNQTTLNGSNSNSAAVPAASIVNCGTATVPAAVDVSLPMANATALERYEGMHVNFHQELVISEYFNYDRFGELVLALPLEGESRPFTPTSIVEPGPAALARASQNTLSRITLDDGLGTQNPSFTRHPNGEAFTITNRFRGGDTVQNAVGVLGFDFGLYRIQPTAPAQYTAVNPRPSTPEPVGGSLQVAAMNTLNFFLTPDVIQEDVPPTTADNPADNVCGGNQNVECRGFDADQPDEFTRQRNKLLATLAGLGAEVIGLNEIENTPGVDPLGDDEGPERGIVPGLNALLGAGTYDSIDTGVIGTDAIRVGMIYKPGAVTPVGTFQVLDSSDDPRFLDTKSRPALAQTFRVNTTGAVFTVVVNHLKSKGSACTDVGDPDAGDGQGNCNGTRTLAAQALVDWLATDPTDSNDPDFLVIGDLNSYAMEDPIDAVKAGSDDIAGTGDDYTNLVARYEGTYAYSYVFDGQAGYLDHALSTSSLTAQVTGATEWHVNADEPDLLDYDTTFKSQEQDLIYEPLGYRASDHDPVIVGLNLAPNVGKLTGSGSWADGTFNVVAEFENDTTVLSGSTTLVVADGTFVSTSYDWLLVQGNRATLQGTGTLNGDAGYGFLVSVLDGGSPGNKDRIRVHIWDADGETVYDSQPGADATATPTTQPTSGNIIVHKLK